MCLVDSISNTGDEQDYAVSVCVPIDLSSTELDRCVALVTSGGAVAVGFAQAELPRASVLAVVRHKTEIVGVGAIKRIRDYYAVGIASTQKSGFGFDKNMPEVGYIAVDDRHRGQGLSHRILEQLLAKKDGPLFATTDEVRMKKTLTAHGFAMKGAEWEGDRGQLSLWIRE
jgi:GNAT superfamily N-acetyltransferase